MKFVTSGIPNLDHLLGGLPIAPDTVVIGDEEDVYPFSLRLLWNQLQEGNNCLYGSISRTREDVEEDLIKKGLDVLHYLEKGSLRIVDFLSLVDNDQYSSDERLSIFLSMKEDILIPERCYLVLLKGFLKLGWRSGRFIAFLDSIDILVTLMGLEETLSFKDMMTKLSKENDSIGIGLLYNNYISRKTLEEITEAAGTIIEIKNEEIESIKVT